MYIIEPALNHIVILKNISIDYKSYSTNPQYLRDIVWIFEVILMKTEGKIAVIFLSIE